VAVTSLYREAEEPAQGNVPALECVDVFKLYRSGPVETVALRGAGPGSVILLHDSDAYSAPLSWLRTVGALPLLFEGLDRLGLEAGPG